MTDRQMHFLAWMIATLTDRCKDMDEVRALNAEIRRRSMEGACELHSEDIGSRPQSA